MPGSSPEDKLAEEAVKDTAVSTEAATTTDVKDTSAESSPAETEGAKGDMLSAVKAALKPKEKSPASDEQGSDSEEGKAEVAKEGTEAEPDSDDFTEEELTQLAKLKPKTHKRITNLLDQQKGYLQEIEQLKPVAQQFEQVMTFVKDAGLDKDELNRGFDVMRNLKQDPLRAYEQIKPIFEQLQQIVGEVLPEDLVNEVRSGRITEAHARDLVRFRSSSALNNQRIQDDTRRRQVEQEQTSFNTKRQQAASSVTEWEKSKSKNDPDWKLKQSRVTELIELELYKKQRNDPNYFPNTQEAVSMADEALKKVNEEMKRFAPRLKEVRPVTDVASSRAVAKPTNAVEAAKLALAKTG